MNPGIKSAVLTVKGMIHKHLILHTVAALRQVLAGPMPCHWRNRTWHWDLPV